MSKAETLKEYIKFRRLKNKSRNINDIEHHIKKFINSTRKPLEEFDESVLLNYLDKISPKYTTSSLNTIKSSYIKNFVKWFWEDWSSRFRHLDKLCQTEKVGETYSSAEMLSEEEFKRLVKGEPSMFWKCYFMTLFYSGSRPTEICSLKWDAVEFDEEGAFLEIRSEKNKRSFLKFVPKDVASYLEKLKDNGSEFVFYNSKTKEPISVKGCYRRLRRLSEEVLAKKVNLYLLRHSIASIIYNRDDIKDDDLAVQMGHSKSMKGVYLHNNRDKLKEKAKKIYISPEHEIPEAERNSLKLEVKNLNEEVERLRALVNDVAERESLDISKEFTKLIAGLQDEGMFVKKMENLVEV